MRTWIVRTRGWSGALLIITLVTVITSTKYVPAANDSKLQLDFYVIKKYVLKY